jgi:hypothetical protein
MTNQKSEDRPRISPVHDYCPHSQYFICAECAEIFKKGQLIERERCAKIADRYTPNENEATAIIARAIAGSIRSGK